jgi:hypothetical protein
VIAGRSFGRGGYSPFAERCLDKAFGLSVGAWGVGFGAFGLDAEVMAGVAEAMGLLAGPVVGQEEDDSFGFNHRSVAASLTWQRSLQCARARTWHRARVRP